MHGSSKRGHPADAARQEIAKSSATRTADGSARALRLGAAVGNDELQRRIEQGNATRDELMAYMRERLTSIREAQLREMNFGQHNMRSVWPQISDHHKADVTKPEPMRWHESARLYEQAAYQLARGSLGRGAELVERAMEAERRAFEAVGKQMGTKELEPGEQGCAALADTQPHQTCAPSDVPADIAQKADEIQRNTTEFKDLPVKKRTADPWWTLEEEEEEEKPEGAE